MAIQNDNTFLSKGDLKAYHEKILPYLGGNIAMSTNNLDYYSTDEKVVGVWLDGKPLYQKTIHTGPFSIEPSSTAAGRGWQRLTAMPANLENLVLARFVNINGTEYKTHQAFAFTMGAIDPGYISVVNFRDVNLAADDAVLFLQYTKTTDTASTALTTPGAYDINFPNTWPENKEIYFGNGLYGKRYTGTYTGQNTTFEVMLDTNLKKADISSIVNHGGSVNRAGGGATQTVNWNNTATMHNMAISTNGVYLQIKENNTTAGHKYDVWMTYTK